MAYIKNQRNRMHPTFRTAMDAVAIITLLVVTLLLISAVVERCTKSSPPYEPVTVNNVHVEPDIVVIGKSVTLDNGVCLNDNEKFPMTVLASLKIEEVTRDTGLVNSGRVIELLSPNTARGTYEIVLYPGDCIGQHIETSETSSLPIGKWRLVVRITVPSGPNNHEQVITRSSNEFQIQIP